MELSDFQLRVLDASVAHWFRTHAGISGLDLARDLETDNHSAMGVVEELVARNFGTMNRDVEMSLVSFDVEDVAAGFSFEAVVTHVFFPSREVLSQAYFASDLPQQRLPEYTIRLHLGAHQYGLIYFTESVLERYLANKVHYQIEDSLAGGQIISLTDDANRNIYVRYGKVALQSGGVAVSAPCVDLHRMSEAEQRFWHAHEIERPQLQTNDPHFQAFLGRTYEGAWVDYDNPLGDISAALLAVNEAVSVAPLFQRMENPHLHLPVAETYKDLCDSASELYKLIGPDNISTKRLRDLLSEKFGVPETSFKHAESQRDLSAKQLMALLEGRLPTAVGYTKALKTVSDWRMDADHRVLDGSKDGMSYSRAFADACREVVLALDRMAHLLK